MLKMKHADVQTLPLQYIFILYTECKKSQDLYKRTSDK